MVVDSMSSLSSPAGDGFKARVEEEPKEAKEEPSIRVPSELDSRNVSPWLG